MDLSAGAGGEAKIELGAASAQVVGVVQNRDDRPVAGATVALIPDSGNHALYRAAIADQAGRFSMQGIAPGDYELLAWEDLERGAYEDREFVKPFLTKAESISLKENGQKSLVLTAN